MTGERRTDDGVNGPVATRTSEDARRPPRPSDSSVTGPEEFGTGGTATGPYRIVNLGSQTVLDVPERRWAPLATVRGSTWDRTAGQVWTLVPNGDGTHRIRNTHSGYVLDLTRRSSHDGANVHQYFWAGQDTQRWRVEFLDGGCSRIENVHSGKVLDVGSQSAGDDANVQQWAWHGGDNQCWRLERPSASERT